MNIEKELQYGDIIVKNYETAALLNAELFGQFSDGYWENSPNEIWRNIRKVRVVKDYDKEGILTNRKFTKMYDVSVLTRNMSANLIIPRMVIYQNIGKIFDKLNININPNYLADKFLEDLYYKAIGIKKEQDLEYLAKYFKNSVYNDLLQIEKNLLKNSSFVEEVKKFHEKFKDFELYNDLRDRYQTYINYKFNNNKELKNIDKRSKYAKEKFKEFTYDFYLNIKNKDKFKEIADKYFKVENNNTARFKKHPLLKNLEAELKNINNILRSQIPFKEKNQIENKIKIFKI